MTTLPSSDSSTAASAVESQPVPRWKGPYSITITLVTAIGLLTLISVGSVLGVGVWLAQKNTFALLSANAHQAVTAAANRIEAHLKPAEHQAAFIAARIAGGDVDPADRERFGLLLSGALAAAPQIDSVMFIDGDLQSYLASYDRKRQKMFFGNFDYTQDPVIRDRMAQTRSGPLWGDAVWRDSTRKSYLNVAYPVIVDGDSIGAVVATVTVEHLSDFVTEIKSRSVGQNFILSGRAHVLAHPMMAGGYPGRSNAAPLPRLSEFRDPVLAAIWRREGRQKLALKLPQGTKGHFLKIGSERYIFIYREIFGFGTKPLISGTYFRDSDVGEEVRRMVVSLFAGIAALIVSLLAAVYIGRKIAGPIVDFSNAASRIRNLDISQVGELPRSIFRELNDQSAAFNAMLRALRWFELYVPKKIVEHLVHGGDVRKTEFDARNVTVMFTDIANFSSISQGLSARDVAALVNHHFALIGACIDAEQGTIDKYMGDSVMAFWGAPDKQKQRAERACRAALAMAAVIRADNEQRKAAGKPPIGIRIGIHTGTVTVGNIGAPGRINYTIIGDAVNVGKRLEALGKVIYPEGTDVSILISGDTARDLGPGFAPVSAGHYALKGREGKVEVFKLC